MKAILVTLVFLVSSGTAFAQIDLSLPWTVENERSYFDAAALDSLIDYDLDQLNYTDGVIVIHRGRVVAERYFNGSSADHQYNIWSVTKSFVSTLIGQAIDQGLLADVDAPLDGFLPRHAGEYLASVTLADLLSMSSGYREPYVYPNWVEASTQELIDMARDEQPGVFRYSSSACHLLAHVLYEGTGLTPHQFAELHLFPALGIADPAWLSGYNGINDGSASLELTLREMAKLGQLYLQNGYSLDSEIVPAEWIGAATSPQATSYDGYGFLWWLRENSFSAIGYGGQHVIVVPEAELVIGVHSALGSPSGYLANLRDVLYAGIVPLFDPSSSSVGPGTVPLRGLTTVYPNPFNPQTTIAFEIPDRAMVNLSVFDLSGRLVANLIISESHAPGRHEVVWNGRDDTGRQVASGTYFYRLDAGEYSETKRMALVK